MVIDWLTAADSCLAKVDVRPAAAKGNTGKLAFSTKVSNDTQIVIEVCIRTGGKQRTKSVESSGSWHSHSGIGTGAKTIGLIGSEEEELVFPDWTTKRKAESVLRYYGLSCTVSSLTCSQ